MDRGAWQPISIGSQELDTTEETERAHMHAERRQEGEVNKRDQ